MAIGINEINDLDFEEEFEVQKPISEEITEPQDQNQPQSPNVEHSSDIITELLRDRGIEDSNKIKFEGEDGIITERSWNDLSPEEQKEILNQSPSKDPDVDLDEEEIKMINSMRLHGMNPQEYVQALRNQGAQQNQTPEEPNYEVDDLTDDELFMLDLQYRSPDMSEEEIYQALDNAKQNKEVFEKQMQGTREYYKGLEQDIKNQKNLEAQEQEKQNFQKYSNAIMDSIQSINSIGNLDINLNQEDQEELAQFILGRDQAGINWFGKALEDPDTVVRMAWFALKGEDVFNDIENYISQQIKTASQNSYNKGLEDGKKSRQKESNVVINPKSYQSTNTQKQTINDLDF